MLGVTLRSISIPSKGSNNTPGNWDKLWPCEPPGSCATLPTLPYIKKQIIQFVFPVFSS